MVLIGAVVLALALFLFLSIDTSLLSCVLLPLQNAEQLGAAEEQVAGSGAKTAAAEKQVSPWF